MSQILGAPILQSGVISALEGKEDWSENYSAVNPKHLIEHWAHTYAWQKEKNKIAVINWKDGIGNNIVKQNKKLSSS